MNFKTLIYVYACITIASNPVFCQASDQKKLNLVDRPVQLVKPDLEHKKLIVIQENLRMLHSLNDSVATVAVVGKYHTGKSFLMNQLMEKSHGFEVGPNVKPETMGIWMWGKPMKLKLKDGKSISVIFLDTEGFAAMNVSENYDAKIFAVATLMSSFLIYNSVKIIDQADIDYLELLARRTQLFALRSQMSQAKWTDQFNQDLLNFPPLLWVVQDFVQATDESETPKDWLHKLMETHVRENEDYVISLLGIFPSVDCQTLFLPAVKKKLLNNLSLAKKEDLTEEYVTEIEQLKDKLRHGIVPKEKNEKPLNGPELASLLTILVNAANEGSLSEVPTRWRVLVDRLQKTATEDCLKFYEDEMSTLSMSSKIPVKMEILHDHHLRVANNSMNLLTQLLLGLNDSLIEATDVLQQKISLQYDQIINLNVKNIKLFCSEQLHRIQIDCEAEINKIRLPVGSKRLVEDLNSINTVKIVEFRNNIKELISETNLQKNLDTLRVALRSLSDNVISSNNKAIESLLESSVLKSIDLFKLKSVPKNQAPMTEKNLKKLHEIATNVAHKHFLELITFARNEDQFLKFTQLLKNKIQEQCKELIMQNEKKLEEELEKELSVLTSTYKEATGPTKIELPMQDNILNSKLNLELRKLNTQFRESWQEFQDFPIFTIKVMKLKENLEKVVEKRRSENIKAFAKEVKAPLAVAKKTILLAIDHYDTVFKTKQYIQRVCLLHLNEGKAKEWSDDLKDRIIEDFIQSDDELSKAVQSKAGWWSHVMGFLQWIWWLIAEMFH